MEERAGGDGRAWRAKLEAASELDPRLEAVTRRELSVHYEESVLNASNPAKVRRAAIRGSKIAEVDRVRIGVEVKAGRYVSGLLSGA
jgi:hypothetical protein